MTNKEIKSLSLTITFICLLGIVFRLAYPYVAHGQEANLEQQLAGLKMQLSIERLISQNIDLKFQLNQSQLAQFEQLKARLDQLEKLQADNENLRRAHTESQDKIKSMESQVQAIINKIKDASRGTPVAVPKSGSTKLDDISNPESDLGRNDKSWTEGTPPASGKKK